MFRIRSNSARSTALAIIAAFLVTGCASNIVRSPKPRSDWSRGMRVGFAETLTQPSLLLDADGTADIAWTAQTSANSGQLGFSKISPQGELLNQSLIPIPEGHLRSGFLRRIGDSLELCWISDRGVRCSPFDDTQPEQISPYTLVSAPPDIRVFDSVDDHLAWVSQDGDLYLSLAGQEPMRLASNVVNIDLSVYGDRIVLAWTDAKSEGETTFWLAVGNEHEIDQPHEIARISSGVLAGLRQVGLGSTLTQDQACIVYGYEFTRGLEGGSGSTVFDCFDTQTRRTLSSQRIELVITERPERLPYSGPFALTRLSRIEIPRSDFTYLPSDPILRDGQVAIAVSTPAQLRYKVRQQIALLLLQDGEVLGYQPVTSTSSSSLYPNLATDADGNLYLAWLERTTGNEIYFTTTNSQASAYLNQVTLSEMSVLVLDIMIDAIAGLFILPLALLWIGVTFLAVFISAQLSQWIGLKRWRDRIGFGVGLLVLWLIKLLFMPQMATYIPFSEWIPELSPSLSLAYQLFWPLLILGVSLILAFRLSKRWDQPTLMARFGIYALSDVILTALIYGSILQGAT